MPSDRKQTKTDTNKTASAYLRSAVFLLVTLVVCWLTVSGAFALIALTVILCATVASNWLYGACCALCPECRRVPNLWRPWQPHAMCPHCCAVIDGNQFQLGQPGQIDLTGHSLFAHPQPICQMTALIVALCVRDRANEIVVDPDGSIQVQVDDGERFQMVPMPPHLALPVRNLFKSIIRRASTTTNDGEVDVIVPLETGDHTTIRGFVRFSPLHKAERMIVQLDKLRRDKVVRYSRAST